MHAKTLTTQREYNISANAYMEKGDWLFINVDKHATVKIFDTEALMRAHWLECYSIELNDVIASHELPDSTNKPAPRLKNTAQKKKH